MKYQRFKYLVEKMQKCSEKMDKYYNVLNITEVWDDFNAVISFLLEEVYAPQAIEYVLEEWLRGSRNPIRYRQKDGSEIEVPCKTMKQLWQAMEGYRLQSDDEAPDIKTPMTDEQMWSMLNSAVKRADKGE